MILTKADMFALTQLLDRAESSHSLAILGPRIAELTDEFAKLSQRCQTDGMVVELTLRRPHVMLCDVCEEPLTDADTTQCPHCGTVWAIVARATAPPVSQAERRRRDALTKHGIDE